MLSFFMFYTCRCINNRFNILLCFHFGFFFPLFFLISNICLNLPLKATNQKSFQETTNFSFLVTSVPVKAWVCWLYKGSHEARSSASPILVKPKGFTMYKDLMRRSLHVVLKGILNTLFLYQAFYHLNGDHARHIWWSSLNCIHLLTSSVVTVWYEIIHCVFSCKSVQISFEKWLELLQIMI